MNFTEAAELKRFILNNFSVALHIHDTCSGLYLSLDEPNPAVKEFILGYCCELGIPVTVSADGTQFFPGLKADDGSGDDPVAARIGRRIRIEYEPAHRRSAAYDGTRQIGTCTYHQSGGVWTIDRTVVEPSYRQMGIAARLVERVAQEADRKGAPLKATCSYAVDWIEQNRPCEVECAKEEK